MRTTRSIEERDFMFYVVLIVIAVIIGAALYMVRGRTSA
jgi:hypothetical protein